jgi:hypothetical protein
MGVEADFTRAREHRSGYYHIQAIKCFLFSRHRAKISIIKQSFIHPLHVSGIS